ncbi:OPT oligopeptide transporter [Lactifluus volemus]|nr:OPT oligopeptide transporter [Lactifluus volemus]
MEDFSKTDSPSVFDTPRLHHRTTIPDVPQDIDIEDEFMLHFNDPNWDYQSNSSTVSTWTDSEECHPSTNLSVDMDSTTQFDTESPLSSSFKPGPKADEAINFQESPYAEVRAAVSNTDDPTMAVNTFRVWFLGILFSLIISSFNTVISMRFPTVFINVLLALTITYPFGKLLEWTLPRYRFSVFRYSFSLNPGPFTIKEHTLITIMLNVVILGSPVTDISAASRILYGQRWSVGNQFLLGLTFQLFGFAIAGSIRQFIVWPSSMIWPGVLVRCAFLNTLHSNHGKSSSKHISRQRFLYIAMACSFMYYWFPGYLWTGLSVFNWVCWIAPNNVVVNSLFGTVSGFGMGLLTLDWAQVTLNGSPLVIPWWAQLNMLGGFLVIIWFICPILWAKNVFYSQFMPVSVATTFDNTGAPYNLSAILTNGAFDLAKYEQYSPMFLPITFAITNGTIFMTFPALLVHTFLWYRNDIYLRLRSSLKDENDIHSSLMRKYPEVPRWWFAALGVFSIVIGIIAIEVLHIGLPVWAFIFSNILAIIFVIPAGIIQAITDQLFSPRHPLAMMVFRSVSADMVTQALAFSSDLKFGHYMKVPPRLVFIGQVVASVVALFSSIVAQQWALDNIPDICDPHQKSFFTCPFLNLFSSVSIFWGGIGSKRFFSPGAIYHPLLWFFLIGAILPIPFYLLACRYPRSVWRYVNIPVALFMANAIPPFNGVNVITSTIVGSFFQFFMRRYHIGWWVRYNYLLSSGLDAGVIASSVILFFALQLPKGGFTVNWWGNTVWQNTADSNMTALRTVPSGQFFGPSTWT